MKNLVFILLVLLLSGNQISAKNNYKTETTWLGLDFTQAKLFPSGAFTNPNHIKESYLNKWNQIVVSESKKFNIAKFFKIKTLQYDLTIIEKRNATVSPENLVVNKTRSSFSEADVKNIIANYPKGEGIALVFIVESFNKANSTGTFWATFFDQASLEIVSTKRIQGIGSGVGLRNFWANSAYRAMKSYKN